MNSNSFRTGVGTLALALVCGASAQSLNGVETKKLNGGLQVKIQGEDLGQPKASWSKSKNMFFLTFDGKLTSKPKTVKVGSNGVQAVSYATISRKASKVRVAMSLAQGSKPELVQQDGQWAVNFNVAAPVAQVPVSPKYPNSVPPIQPAYKQADLQVNNSPAGNYSNAMQVDLDFVNTDIVQILKALALQSNVNIVTGPELNLKDNPIRITVTLDSVSVKDALDIVTSLGGVRYAKVGNTYIVTSNSRFSDTLMQVKGSIDVSSETRVVPLYSGQGIQVKTAVLKMVNPSTMAGRYDLLLPSDNVKVNTLQGSAQVSKDSNDGKSTSGSVSTIETASDSNKSTSAPDDYLVIVGSPTRLDEVEKTVRTIDSQICKIMGVTPSGSTGVITKNFEPKGTAAIDLLDALREDQSSASANAPANTSRIVKFGNVTLVATPKTSSSRQVIALTGRAVEVENLFSMLSALDSTPANTQFEVIGIKHAKPQVVLAQLLGTFPSLKGSLMPAPVDPMVGIRYGDSKLSVDPAANRGNGQAGSDQQQDNGQAASQGGSSPVGTWLTKDNIAAALALGEVESGADGKSNSVPMKVILRGTREQIAEARQFIEMIDVAPKQVAVEVRVMELTKEDALKIGIDWSLLTGGTLTNLRVNQGIGSANSAGGIGSNLGFKGGGTASLTGTLDSIANKNNMLARPNMLATDGIPSTVFVGDTVRYVKSIQSTQNGTTVVTDEINVGVDFALIARIGEGGNISVELNPVLSILQGFTDVPGGGQLPQTSVRSARMQVNIGSGETVAIGGLITEQDKKSYGGIPILKDLPLIGQLFGRTNNTKIRSEVVFFVTVKEVTQADRQSAANPRQSEKDNTQWPGSDKKGNGKG